MDQHLDSEGHKKKAKGKGIAEAYRLNSGPAPAIRFLDRRNDGSADLYVLPPKEAAEFLRKKEEPKAAVNLEIVYRYACENLGKASQRQKQDYDLQIHTQQYVPGDLVCRQYPRSKKLEHLWVGPLVVTKRYNDSLYQAANRKKSFVLHHDLLRPYTASLVPNWAQALCRNCQKAN